MLAPQRKMFRIENGYPVEILYRKPKWYNIIYDATDERCGQIMVAYSLIERQHVPTIDRHLSEVNNFSIRPRGKPFSLHIFCIGLRDILEEHPSRPAKRMNVSFRIAGQDKPPVQTDYKKV
jgi:hypothetical protein